MNNEGKLGLGLLIALAVCCAGPVVVSLAAKRQRAAIS